MKNLTKHSVAPVFLLFLFIAFLCGCSQHEILDNSNSKPMYAKFELCVQDEFEYIISEDISPNANKSKKLMSERVKVRISNPTRTTEDKSNVDSMEVLIEITEKPVTRGRLLDAIKGYYPLQLLFFKKIGDNYVFDFQKQYSYNASTQKFECPGYDNIVRFDTKYRIYAYCYATLGMPGNIVPTIEPGTRLEDVNIYLDRLMVNGYNGLGREFLDNEHDQALKYGRSIMMFASSGCDIVPSYGSSSVPIVLTNRTVLGYISSVIIHPTNLDHLGYSLEGFKASFLADNSSLQSAWRPFSGNAFGCFKPFQPEVTQYGFRGGYFPIIPYTARLEFYIDSYQYVWRDHLGDHHTDSYPIKKTFTTPSITFERGKSYGFDFTFKML